MAGGCLHVLRSLSLWAQATLSEVNLLHGNKKNKKVIRSQFYSVVKRPSFYPVVGARLGSASEGEKTNKLAFRGSVLQDLVSNVEMC